MSAGLGEAVYLCGEITDSRRELWANVTYLLGCPVYVRDGATLVLEPGTMIAAVPKDPSHPDVPVLVVERGGRIIADCSAERPCTFTAANPGETESNEQVQTDSSSSATVVYGARGKWGGVVLAGRADRVEILAQLLALRHGYELRDEELLFSRNASSMPQQHCGFERIQNSTALGRWDCWLAWDRVTPASHPGFDIAMRRIETSS